MGLTNKVSNIEVKQGHLPNHSDQAVHYESPNHLSHQDMELDAIEQLKSNILMLDDLQSRLRFMNNELETLLGLKKKSSK
jgi:hypothetical protein